MRSAPPDFRYVGLWPSPSGRRVRIRATAIGVAAFGLGTFLAGPEPVTLALAGLAGLATGLLVNRRSGPTRLASDVQAPMAIVPWGVMVRSETSLRVLRWPAIVGLTVDFVHEMDHATPSTRWSVVTIRTAREVLGGRAPGYLPLEVLEACHSDYAEQAGRRLALDPWGIESIESAGEPSVQTLLDRSRHLLHSGALRDAFDLSARGYRGGSDVSSRSLTRLQELLRSEPDGPDPRPIAAILAAELDARPLSDDVAALALSPHPVLAAVARVAALRLGVDVQRVGALDELQEFLPVVDFEALGAWLIEPEAGSVSGRSSSKSRAA